MTTGVRRKEPARSGSMFANLLAIVASIRRLLFHGSNLLPALLAAIAIVLTLRPMLFEPELRLEGLLASMAGVGLSFASVSFTAANALRERRAWSGAMVAAALMLLRYSLAIVLVLALSTARVRLTNDFGSGTALDWTLRGAMTAITALAIVLAFLGFRALVYLLGPGLATAEPASADDSTPDRERPAGGCDPGLAT